MSKTSKAGKSRRSPRAIDKLLAEAYLKLLERRGGEPYIDARELCRRAGVHRNVTHRHIARGFVAAHNREIASELRGIVRETAEPEMLTIRMLSCVRKNSVWFSIEEVRKSRFLRETLEEALYAPLTGNWLSLDERRNTVRYKNFFDRFFEIVADWRREQYAPDTARRHERRLAAILAACARGDMNAVIYG